MKRIFEKKVAAGRTGTQARVGVERLEGRELMATGFTLVDTLNAKDAIDLDRLGAFAGIETLRTQNVTQLQTVIANGAAATQALGSRFAALQVQYSAAVAAGDAESATALKESERIVLTTGANVRAAMRLATSVASATDNALIADENQVNAIYRAAVGNLSRHANPFTLVPPVVNALTVVTTTAQTQAIHGSAALRAINFKLTG